MKKKRENQLLDSKEVEYYSVSVNAWYQTRMEKDKSLLTLSVAGVGLLVTLLSGVTTWALWVGVTAIIFFILCAILIINVFEKNSVHIEDIIQDKESPINLHCYDILIKWLFILGVITSLGFAICSYLIETKVL